MAGIRALHTHMQRRWCIRGVRHFSKVGETLVIFWTNELQKRQPAHDLKVNRKNIMPRNPLSVESYWMFDNVYKQIGDTIYKRIGCIHKYTLTDSVPLPRKWVTRGCNPTSMGFNFTENW